MKYDDYHSKGRRSTTLVSLILLILVFIGAVVYLILFPVAETPIEEPPVTVEELPTNLDEELVEELTSTPSNEFDWKAMYLEAEKKLSEQRMNYLELTAKRNEADQEVMKEWEAKELEYQEQIQIITGERDEYKRAYEELDAYASELIEVLKGL